METKLITIKQIQIHDKKIKISKIVEFNKNTGLYDIFIEYDDNEFNNLTEDEREELEDTLIFNFNIVRR